MANNLRVWAILVPAFLFGLVVLPVIPQSETTSVDLKTAGIEPASKLLGENQSTLRNPPRESGPPETVEARDGGIMTLTVPKLGLKNVAVPTASTQARLDRVGIIHLANTGLPWQEGSNTFLVGHRLGFMRTKVPYAFYKLDKMRPGDKVVARDTSGKSYVYRVYDVLTVRPSDYWVTYPVDGKTVISLQTCAPIPTFENRLVVRAELVG